MQTRNQKLSPLERVRLRLLRLADENAPVPRLANTEGHERCSARRYQATDAKQVASRLDQAFEVGPERGTYAWSDGKTMRGALLLKGGTLTAETNSRERLVELKQLLEALLGASIVHRLDAHEDAAVALQVSRDRSQARDRRGAPELPPEVAREVQAMMLARMRQWLDKPIPMLKGKTPRQAARSERGRDDVTLILTQQEQLFQSGPGMLPIDLTEIWRELGIEPRA